MTRLATEIATRPDLDEEAALNSYLNHFNLSRTDVDSNDGYSTMLKAAVIREVAEGRLPQRLDPVGRIPFNLMKSEQLVWMGDDVEYLEEVTRRERRGTSHGVSMRVSKGLYYSPRAFSSASHEWQETVHVDTGLIGVTTKHIYFHGSRKRFRVRYDRISHSSHTRTASGSCVTPRRQSRSHSSPGTAGSSTT